MSLARLRLLRARDLERPDAHVTPAPRALEDCDLSGRLTEIAAGDEGARSSLATAILRRTQARGETAAWIGPRHIGVYLPDLAEHGVDLDALIFVRIPPHELPHGIGRAAEMLGRSGAFGLLVLDLDLLQPPAPSTTQGWSGRLASLARAHALAVVALTPQRPDEATPSTTLGSLVTVHLSPRRARLDDRAFALRHSVHRFKPGGPPPLLETRWRGPWGLG